MTETAQSTRRTLLDAEGLARTLDEMAERLRTLVGEGTELALVGIRMRGVPLAERLRAAISPDAPLGTLDITLYRDDLSSLGPQPIVGPTQIAFDVDNRTVVLVDDVLFTGRTARAALEALVAFGRPKAVRLAVLVDRGSREYPIQPDVAGLTVETAPHESVEVHLTEVDGDDRVDLVTP